MDNPVRTADYFARRDVRIADLRSLFASALAGRTSITLEIGCGHGHFLTAYAAAHPDVYCVGIDLLKDRIERATRKRDRAKLGNLLFVQGDAFECLQALPDAVMLSRIFILFPDPWPKRRHHKNRIIQPEFLSLLASKASPEARLYFRTDYAPYFADAHTVAGGHSDWILSADAPWPFELTTVFQSRAESYQSLVAARRNPVT